jgi:hypothetical protein
MRSETPVGATPFGAAPTGLLVLRGATYYLTRWETVDENFDRKLLDRRRTRALKL